MEKDDRFERETIMADESNTEIVETAPPAEVAPPKKRRGPRPKNVVAETTADVPGAAAAQPVRGQLQSSTTLQIFSSSKKRTRGCARRWPKNCGPRTPTCASGWALPDQLIKGRSDNLIGPCHRILAGVPLRVAAKDAGAIDQFGGAL
ncbi:hypothetical protein AB4Z53_20095 [Ensifer sp. 2TAB8]